MSNSAGGVDGLNNENKQSMSGNNHHVVRRIIEVTLLFVGVAVLSLVTYKSAYPLRFLPKSYYYPSASPPSISPIPEENEVKLDVVLKKASMVDRTVILTTLNDAWAEPNNIFDLFLESFRIGNHTHWLLKHLVIICLDQKAYARCLASHPHCYNFQIKGDNFTNEALFMTPSYLKMMWTRIDLLRTILEMGYNFVFTDADVMWLRNPFQRFYSDVDFQIACDRFIGNPDDVRNQPNGGFNYVKSNNRTVQFYEFWYNSREAYPGYHDQDVLDKIKQDPFITGIGMKMKFLDTAYFGGFCEPSRDLNLVCTMHANCCIGLDNKVNDLKILLEDWRKFISLTPSTEASSPSSWSVPQRCSTGIFWMGFLSFLWDDN
ncbi:nucleotide-diphospho-sugar transferase, nucleotide-diphospho-sugar transferase [Fagus crenata]